MNIFSIFAPKSPSAIIRATRQGTHWIGGFGGTARQDFEGVDGAYARRFVLPVSGNACEFALQTLEVESLTGDGAHASLTVGTSTGALTLTAVADGEAGNSISFSHSMGRRKTLIVSGIESHPASNTELHHYYGSPNGHQWTSTGESVSAGISAGATFTALYYGDGWFLKHFVDGEEVYHATAEDPAMGSAYPDDLAYSVSMGTGIPEVTAAAGTDALDPVVSVAGQSIALVDGSLGCMIVRGDLYAGEELLSVSFPTLYPAGMFEGKRCWTDTGSATLGQFGCWLGWYSTFQKWTLFYGTARWRSLATTAENPQDAEWDEDSAEMSSEGIPAVYAAPLNFTAGMAAAVINASSPAAALVAAAAALGGAGKLPEHASSPLTGGVEASSVSGVDGLDHEGHSMNIGGLRGVFLRCESGGVQVQLGSIGDAISLNLLAGEDVDLRFATSKSEFFLTPMTVTATENDTVFLLEVMTEQAPNMA